MVNACCRCGLHHAAGAEKPTASASWVRCRAEKTEFQPAKSGTTPGSTSPLARRPAPGSPRWPGSGQPDAVRGHRRRHVGGCRAALGGFWHRAGPAPAGPGAGHRGDLIQRADDLRAGLPAIAAAMAFGLVFELPPELVAFYGGVANDLPVRHGNGRWALPVPATSEHQIPAPIGARRSRRLVVATSTKARDFIGRRPCPG